MSFTALIRAALIFQTVGAAQSAKSERIAVLRSENYDGALGPRQSPSYGTFPRPKDPFHFLPCTNSTIPPRINDKNAEQTWLKLFDPDPDNWMWGDAPKLNSGLAEANQTGKHAGRGLYLCGYLDVPMDYTNKSDARIVRLSVAKYQVRGPGKKTERTVVIEPGGPGESGVDEAIYNGERTSERLSRGRYDVLGWDPRGVNGSQPSLSCFPYSVYRDRWRLLATQDRKTLPLPRKQLEVMDAMNDATFQSCAKSLGDFPRFVTTAFVARDLEAIRIGLQEPELSGYLVSYGTTVAQTYANMFPSRVGRMILDGVDYARFGWVLGGFATSSIENITDAWNDGVLGECVKAGPKHCELAKPVDGTEVTLKNLKQRMNKLFKSVAERPVTAYTGTAGPSIITYSTLISEIYSLLYNPKNWPDLASMLARLEAGNSSLAATTIESDAVSWSYNPPDPITQTKTEELSAMVICADAYDSPPPANGLDWWDDLWKTLTDKAWLGGDVNFYSVLSCQNFVKYWPKPAEVYRGNFSKHLKTPILLVSQTHDPATPLRNGRALHKEMGTNARMIVHHGYGHTSIDKSNCTDTLLRAYMLDGTLPEKMETDCYADQKPYQDSSTLSD